MTKYLRYIGLILIVGGLYCCSGNETVPPPNPENENPSAQGPQPNDTVPGDTVPDDSVPGSPVAENPSIYGLWQLRVVEQLWDGGGIVHYPEDTGDTVILKALENDSMYIYRNGMVDQLGTYEIVEQESQLKDEMAPFLIFDEASSFAPYQLLILKLSADTLIYRPDYEGGTISTYVRGMNPG